MCSGNGSKSREIEKWRSNKGGPIESAARDSENETINIESGTTVVQAIETEAITSQSQTKRTVSTLTKSENEFQVLSKTSMIRSKSGFKIYKAS